MWVSIVNVSVRLIFFVFGVSDKDDIVRICCNAALNFFVSLTVNVKMSYILFVT